MGTWQGEGSYRRTLHQCQLHVSAQRGWDVQNVHKDMSTRTGHASSEDEARARMRLKAGGGGAQEHGRQPSCCCACMACFSRGCCCCDLFCSMTLFTW
jgi:hypothetical protein